MTTPLTNKLTHPEPRHGQYRTVREDELTGLGAGWELIRTLRTVEYQKIEKPIFNQYGGQERSVWKSVRAPRIRFLVGLLTETALHELRQEAEKAQYLRGQVNRLEYELKEALEEQVKISADFSISKSYIQAQDFTLKKHQATIELLEKDIGKIREVVGSAKMKEILGR